MRHRRRTRRCCVHQAVFCIEYIIGDEPHIVTCFRISAGGQREAIDIDGDVDHNLNNIENTILRVVESSTTNGPTSTGMPADNRTPPGASRGRESLKHERAPWH